MGYTDYRFYRFTTPSGKAPYVMGMYQSGVSPGKCADGYIVMQWDLPLGSGALYNMCIPAETAHLIGGAEGGGKPSADGGQPSKADAEKPKSGPMEKAENEAAEGAKSEIAEEAYKRALAVVIATEEAVVDAAERSVSEATKRAVEENGGNEEDYIIDGAEDKIVVGGNEEDKEDDTTPAGPPGDDPDPDENDSEDDELPPETTYIEGPDEEDMYVEEELVHMGDWCPGCNFDWENFLILGIPDSKWHVSSYGPPFTHHAKGFSEWVLGGLDQRYFLRKGEYGIWLEAGQWHWSAPTRWGGGGARAGTESSYMSWEYSVIYHGIANDEATDVAWGQKQELGLWGDPLGTLDVYAEDYMKMLPDYGEDVWASFEAGADDRGDEYWEDWHAYYDIDIWGTAEVRGLLWRFGYYCDAGGTTGSKVRWEGDGCTYTYRGDASNRSGWADNALTNLDDDTDCAGWELGVVHCWYNTEMSTIMEIVSALTPLDSSRYYKRIPTKKITKSDLTAMVGTAAVDSDAVEDIYGTAATTTEAMVAEGTYETVPGAPGGGVVTDDY